MPPAQVTGPDWLGDVRLDIAAKAAGGDPAMIPLRDSGAVRSVRDAYDWVTSHRVELATHLR